MKTCCGYSLGMPPLDTFNECQVFPYRNKIREIYYNTPVKWSYELPYLLYVCRQTCLGKDEMPQNAQNVASHLSLHGLPLIQQFLDKTSGSKLYLFKFENKYDTRVLQKVLSLGSDYFSATFYQTYFYYKPSRYSPFTETHFL